MISACARIGRKIIRAGMLAVRDPVKFAEIIDQYIRPENFRRRLLDFDPIRPINVVVNPALTLTPTLNVLLPVIEVGYLTGGPNTALNLAVHVAAAGVPVRLIATGGPVAPDTLDRLWPHLVALTGVVDRPRALSVMSCADRNQTVELGGSDVFLATHWTTAQLVKYALPMMKIQEFFYLIQDFEPGFYEWSSHYALALETYGLSFRPIVNEQTLADFLRDQRIGRFADSGFAARSSVFMPAVDRQLFYAENEERRRARANKRFVFYARPTNPRNLLGLGYHAIDVAAREGAFGAEPWEIVLIGGAMPSITLSDGTVVRSMPWLSYQDYAKLLRESDVLLSLMLSPHTSYPPLEMAASGGITVTNSFANKSREALERLSPNLLAVPPTMEGVVKGIHMAVARARTAGNSNREATLAVPQDWQQALAGPLRYVIDGFRELTKLV